MPRKIIFAVTNDLSYDQRMIRICNSLVTHGYEVVLVGRKKANSIPLIPQKFQQYRFNLWFSKGKLFYLAYNFRLFFFLLSHRFDMLGSVDLDTLLPCFLVAKIKAKPCIFDAHEYFTEVPEVVHRPFTKSVWESIGNFIIPRLKYAYTVSASLQKLFSKKYGIPFQLIRNISVAKPKFIYRKEQKEKSVILYQGVLNEGRGLAELIATMPRLNQAELWLAGEGDLSEELRQLVIHLSLQNSVKFLGYLSPEELQKITPQATIGINLLENRGLSYYYSLANKTFDYIQAELPAIHMNFPEYQAINQAFEIGVLVDNLQPENLLAALQKLFNDKPFYQQIKANCHAAKQVYNWEKEEQKLIEFYRNI